MNLAVLVSDHNHYHNIITLLNLVAVWRKRGCKEHCGSQRKPPCGEKSDNRDKTRNNDNNDNYKNPKLLMIIEFHDFFFWFVFYSHLLCTSQTRN